VRLDGCTCRWNLEYLDIDLPLLPVPVTAFVGSDPITSGRKGQKKGWMTFSTILEGGSPTGVGRVPE